MRKADYAALADIIKTGIAATLDAPNSSAWEIARAKRRALKELAHEFAARTHVDRVAFLKACGIEE